MRMKVAGQLHTSVGQVERQEEARQSGGALCHPVSMTVVPPQMGGVTGSDVRGASGQHSFPWSECRLHRYAHLGKILPAVHL